MVSTIPSWGEVVEETPPARQNRCLVSEHFTESGAGLPHDYPLTVEAKKTPPTEQVEDVSADEQEPISAPVALVEDDVVELHVGTEDLD